MISEAEYLRSGSGGYVPSAQPTAPGTSTSGPSGVTGGGADPFTGGNSRRPALTHIPAGVFYIFDSVPKLDAIGGKVRGFSSGLSASPDTASLSLTEPEVAPGGTLDTLLAKYVHPAVYFSYHLLDGSTAESTRHLHSQPNVLSQAGMCGALVKVA